MENFGYWDWIKHFILFISYEIIMSIPNFLDKQNEKEGLKIHKSRKDFDSRWPRDL